MKVSKHFEKFGHEMCIELYVQALDDFKKETHSIFWNGYLQDPNLTPKEKDLLADYWCKINDLKIEE